MSALINKLSDGKLDEFIQKKFTDPMVAMNVSMIQSKAFKDLVEEDAQETVMKEYEWKMFAVANNGVVTPLMSLVPKEGVEPTVTRIKVKTAFEWRETDVFSAGVAIWVYAINHTAWAIQGSDDLSEKYKEEHIETLNSYYHDIRDYAIGDTEITNLDEVIGQKELDKASIYNILD